MKSVSFFVQGIPVAKGSARAFLNKKTGRPIVIQDNKEKQTPWASAISFEAKKRIVEPTRQPVNIMLNFRFLRPKLHFGAKGKIKPRFSAALPAHKPDLDKLVRLVEDALTGIVYHDDGQIVQLQASKCYHAVPGLMVCVEWEEYA